MLKIRRPLGRLIFNMGITIPCKTVFLIETAPWLQWISQRQLQDETSNIFSFGILMPVILDVWLHIVLCITKFQRIKQRIVFQVNQPRPGWCVVLSINLTISIHMLLSISIRHNIGSAHRCKCYPYPNVPFVYVLVRVAISGSQAKVYMSGVVGQYNWSLIRLKCTCSCVRYATQN